MSTRAKDEVFGRVAPPAGLLGFPVIWGTEKTCSYVLLTHPSLFIALRNAVLALRALVKVFGSGEIADTSSRSWMGGFGAVPAQAIAFERARWIKVVCLSLESCMGVVWGM
jgi:hypothetical protein